MSKVIIVTYSKSFDFSKNSFIIGGLETYIQDLALLVASRGGQVTVMLPTPTEIVTKYNGIDVYGVRVGKPSKKDNQKVCDLAIKMINSPQDRVIVASEQINVKARHPQVIVIQHGIGWDVPADFLSAKEKSSTFIARLGKLLRCVRHIHKFNSFCNVVCVDYNYINWYRTLDTIRDDMHVTVIPNYTSSLADVEQIQDKLVNRREFKIIFARRFVDYRGAKMFLNISKRLLAKFENIKITFAGDGPLKSEIERTFINESRVEITSFKPMESVAFHSKYDIAVVPTIFSEGTSLSLCEAMAAGCLPVVTFVGGMSNMILDGYNGLMCYPSEEDFYKTMVRALNMPENEFNGIVSRARETVESSFSLQRWQNQWIEILGI